MPAERMLPSTEAADLLALTRDLAAAELAPIASEYEAASRFPRDKFRLLGKSGLLGLPYPEQWGGSALSYEVYLQVLEELAAAWMTVAVGLSVHTMSCYPLATFGADEQRDALAARSAGRGPAGRVRAVRAGGGLGRGGAAHPCGPRRRGLRGDRHEGVDHPRRRGRFLHR